jgi:hypothetical protein
MRTRKALGLATAAVLAAMGVRSASASTIAGWDFDAGGTIAAPYNTPAATSGTGSATQLGMTNGYTFNNGEGPGSVASCDVLASAGASTGAGSFGWRVRGNGNSANSGAGVANGWNSNAPIGTQGAQFNVSTSGYSGITVSADINATGQAERNLAIEYTLDDTQVTPVWVDATLASAGNATVETNSSSVNTIVGSYVELSGGGSGWNNLITASLPSAADNDPNIAMEIVNASTGADCVNTSGASLNNSSGNWRFDNITVSGTPVPEPASASLLGLAGLALLNRRRSKAK